MAETKPVNLAVFVSGGGTTLQNFIDMIQAGTLPARIAVVLASKKSAYGLVRARCQRSGWRTSIATCRSF
ncbi:phosphoribosylglycinamide formyltransferase, partial [Planctomycetota bacterium]